MILARSARLTAHRPGSSAPPAICSSSGCRCRSVVPAVAGTDDQAGHQYAVGDLDVRAGAGQRDHQCDQDQGRYVVDAPIIATTGPECRRRSGNCAPCRGGTPRRAMRRTDRWVGVSGSGHRAGDGRLNGEAGAASSIPPWTVGRGAVRFPGLSPRSTSVPGAGLAPAAPCSVAGVGAKGTATLGVPTPTPATHSSVTSWPDADTGSHVRWVH